MSLDLVIRESLQQFLEDAHRLRWWGREREVISIYALGNLVPLCAEHSPLYHPCQIGIEVAVPQIDKGGKEQVCKDLVIWQQPYMTCWNDEHDVCNSPLAIMEWKARTNKLNEKDIIWLQRFSTMSPEFIGFAVSFKDFGDGRHMLRAGRIQNGWVERGWLEVSAGL